jgi:hypothetical protein
MLVLPSTRGACGSSTSSRDGCAARQFGYGEAVVKRLAGTLLLLVLLTATACRPSAPDEHGWRSSAAQAVTDMVSEVATSRLTVQQELRGRFVGRYAVVVLTYSEEAAGTASDSISTLQPPPSARPSYDDLTTLLSDATDAVAGARVAVASGDVQKSREALVDLSQVLPRLRTLAQQLRAAR